MAISVNDSVVIARPVPEVFAFVADHENLPAWTVGLLTPIMSAGVRRQVKADHRRLKTVLEHL
jgi:uncharacterized protein YndB with AHSA1/START domain